MTRERLRGYITQAQREGGRDRREFASIIKKMLQFNALMVTPLLEKVKVSPMGYCVGCRVAPLHVWICMW